MYKNIVAVFLFVFLISGVALAEGLKVGYIDVPKIFDEYKKIQDFDKKLEKVQEDKQTDRDKIVNEIRKMRDELELLAEAARAKKQGTIDEKLKNLQDFDKDVRNGLKSQRDDMMREILKELDDTVTEYGKKNGYDLIFNDRVLIYKAEKYDLTGEVIGILNKGYKK
ncbi:MAG: hypothetical protein AUJ75_04810 [Candidatus Omnitrophica bacterium CG1_02_49_10]|nr:MAG: hypothetical protein AUJ75_04810 [Candidatus Omnitrophica bacterium CG1_02_49_10]